MKRKYTSIVASIEAVTKLTDTAKPLVSLVDPDQVCEGRSLVRPATERWMEGKQGDSAGV